MYNDVYKLIKESSDISKNFETIDPKLNPIYHISSNDLEIIENGVLSPRVPSNHMTDEGHEDATIDRVSFSETVDGCLMAIGGNIEGWEFNVYIPNHNVNIWNNSIITQYVPDAHLTKEIWIMEEVELKNIGRIKVGSAIDNPKTYVYGDGLKAEIYNWNWEWIKEL